MKVGRVFSARVFVVVGIALGLSALSPAGCSDDGDKAPADLAHFVQTGPPPPDMACVATCTTNAQCQNSCGPPSSGISCCDTTTNQCFTSNTTVCPAPPADLSVTGPY